MANLDGDGRNFSFEDSIDEEKEGPMARTTSRAPSRSISDVKKNLAAAVRNLEERQVRKWRIAHIWQRHINKRIEDKISYLQKVNSYFQPPPVTNERRDDYMSVLHLTMKANFVGFYQQRFLPALFPNSPTPLGLSKSGQSISDDLPDLASESSETSLASGSIEFGAILPSSPIRLLASDSVFLTLAMTGSIGSVSRVRRKVSPKPRDNQKSTDHYNSLTQSKVRDSLGGMRSEISEDSRTVCSSDILDKTESTRPTSCWYDTKQLGLVEWTPSYPLHAWAEIVADGEFPNPVNYSMCMASSGSKGRFSATPSYRATFLANGSPDIKVVGRTDKERDTTLCMRSHIDKKWRIRRAWILKFREVSILLCWFASQLSGTKHLKIRCDYNVNLMNHQLSEGPEPAVAYKSCDK